MPQDNSHARQHLHGQSRPQKTRQRHTCSAFADVYGQYQHTLGETDLIEDIHCAQVMAADVPDIHAFPEAGNEVGRGEGAYQVGGHEGDNDIKNIHASDLVV